VSLEAADELGRKILGVGRGPAVATGQDLAAAGHAGQHRLDGVGDRLGQRLRGLVLEVGAVDEMLLDSLFEHL
jgi:hypothetical protein